MLASEDLMADKALVINFKFMNKPEDKKCNQSCDCGKTKKAKEESQKPNLNLSQESELQNLLEKEPDPTRFGDWQINGRAIDF